MLLRRKSLFLAVSIGLTFVLATRYELVQCQVADDSGTPDATNEQKPPIDTGSEQASFENSPKLKSYTPPKIKRDGVYLFDNFDSEQEFTTKWINSKDPKYNGEWKLNSGPDRPHADMQLLLPHKARHYAISSKLSEPFKFGDEKPLVVQYEVQFREGLDCGGAYVKLLRNSAIDDLTKLTDKTPYTIMFGPDKCGSEAKLHFIAQYYNPKTQEYGEKHWKQAKYVNNLMSTFTDKKHHLFKLVLESNNNFEIFMDGKSVGKGNLLEDVDPPINPPKNIVDPSDSKPDDWDERPQIEDPDATKPDDWDENAPKTIEDPDATKPSDWLEDEPKHIPDPEAKKPDDWADDMDGEWEAPKIDNPACAKVSGCGEWKAPIITNPNYKGKWKPPKIENPNYKGKWEPRVIPNPDYFLDEKPFSSLDAIGAISFELWSMADNIAFDNLIITSNQESAELVQLLTWQDKKAEADATSPSLLTRATHYLKVYPWLWAIVVIAIALPLFLFISYCCETKKAPTDDASKRKKTDESRPDEPADEAGEEEEEEEDDEAVETGEEAVESEEDEEEAEVKDQVAGDKSSSKRPVRQRKN